MSRAKKYKNNDLSVHSVIDLPPCCPQLPGQSRPDRGSRLSAHRAGHPENPSEDHRHRRNPLHLQKPTFQVVSGELPWQLCLVFCLRLDSGPDGTLCIPLLPPTGCSMWEVRGQRGRSGSTALKTWQPLSSASLWADTTRCSTKMKQL